MSFAPAMMLCGKKRYDGIEYISYFISELSIQLDTITSRHILYIYISRGQRKLQSEITDEGRTKRGRITEEGNERT